MTTRKVYQCGIQTADKTVTAWAKLERHRWESALGSETMAKVIDDREHATLSNGSTVFLHTIFIEPKESI